MAKKTKLNEAELIEQNPVEAAPVQAAPEEVQAAAQNVAPVEPVPTTEEEPLVAENEVTDTAKEPAPEPEAETVSIEMQIPKDQLATAVAQVTGDIEAAETAPDVEAEKQSEIAAMENSDELGELTAEEQEVIKEYRKYKANKFRETAEEAPAELNVEDEKDGEQTGAPVDEPQSEYSIIQESEEDDGKEEAEEVCLDCDEDSCEDEEECKEEEEEIEDIDISGLFTDDEESEEIDTSRLADIFGDEEEIEDTIDALNTSADFLSKILSMGDDFEEVVETEPDPFKDPDPMPEGEMKESLNFNKLINKAKAKGFEALGGYDALEREIEEYKTHPEKYAHNPLKGLIDSLLVKRGFMDEDHNWIEPEDDEYEDDYEDDWFEDAEYEDEEEMEESLNFNNLINKAKAKGFEALGGYEALEREIEEYKAHPEKYAHNPLKGLIDSLLVKRGFMDEDHNWIEYDDDEYEDEGELEDFDDEYEPAYEDDYLESKKRTSRRRVKENARDSYDFAVFNTHDSPEYVDYILNPTDEAVDALYDMDANIGFVNGITPGEWFEISYDDGSMYANKSASPEEVLAGLIKDAKAQFEEGEYSEYYFDDLGGTYLNMDDYSSPEEAAQRAFEIYYDESYVDGDSSQAREINQFDPRKMQTSSEFMRRHNFEEKRQTRGQRTRENMRKRQAKSRYNEAIIYPAGSKPLGSEISNVEEENLVRAYEKTAAARRRALSNFRESMRKSSASNVNKAKFNEALSNRKVEKTVVDKKSWSANRFEDKYEERMKLNYKDLLNNGYLG